MKGDLHGRALARRTRIEDPELRARILTDAREALRWHGGQLTTGELVDRLETAGTELPAATRSGKERQLRRLLEQHGAGVGIGSERGSFDTQRHRGGGRPASLRWRVMRSP